MKVLVQTWDYPPAKGGIQVWMFELARRLPDAEVRVLAPASDGDVEFDRSAGVNVTRLPVNQPGQLPWLLRLTAHTLKTCVTWRPDVIVCGHIVTAPAALVARRLFGVPNVVFTYAWEIRRRRRRRLVSAMLRQATLVLAISRFTRDSVLSHGLLPERVRILYPGTDPGCFTPRGNGDVAHAPRRILSVSRLDEIYKGHDTVIRALPLIKAKLGAITYVIAGEGRLRAYLSRLAASLGVEDSVDFLGRVPDEDLPAVYRSADALVQLSREAHSGGGAEGFGIVCLEAAATGKPVVAGRSGGLLDSVVDGVTGLLVDPEDHAEAAEAIISVLSDGGLAARLGRAGRERVLGQFTWDHMAARARALFAEAAGKARA